MIITISKIIIIIKISKPSQFTSWLTVKEDTEKAQRIFVRDFLPDSRKGATLAKRGFDNFGQKRKTQ